LGGSKRRTGERRPCPPPNAQKPESGVITAASSAPRGCGFPSDAEARLAGMTHSSPLRCAACGAPLPPPGRRGPARRYCSASCRAAAPKKRRADAFWSNPRSEAVLAALPAIALEQPQMGRPRQGRADRALGLGRGRAHRIMGEFPFGPFSKVKTRPRDGSLHQHGQPDPPARASGPGHASLSAPDPERRGGPCGICGGPALGGRQRS
jgi:hypothetical protein